MKIKVYNDKEKQLYYRVTDRGILKLVTRIGKAVCGLMNLWTGEFYDNVNGSLRVAGYPTDILEYGENGTFKCFSKRGQEEILKYQDTPINYPICLRLEESNRDIYVTVADPETGKIITSLFSLIRGRFVPGAKKVL